MPHRTIGHPVQLFVNSSRPAFPGQILHLGPPKQPDNGEVVSIAAFDPDVNAYLRYDNVPQRTGVKQDGLSYALVD